LASCFRGPRGLRASSRPSTFVSRKPLHVGYPQASEFFRIGLPHSRPAVEMTLQQAAPAVVRIDFRVPRPVHRPGGLCGVLQDDFIDHAVPSADRTQSLPTQGTPESFRFFPILIFRRREHTSTPSWARSRSAGRRCRQGLRPYILGSPQKPIGDGCPLHRWPHAQKPFIKQTNDTTVILRGFFADLNGANRRRQRQKENNDGRAGSPHRGFNRHNNFHSKTFQNFRTLPAYPRCNGPDMRENQTRRADRGW